MASKLPFYDGMLAFTFLHHTLEIPCILVQSCTMVTEGFARTDNSDTCIVLQVNMIGDVYVIHCMSAILHRTSSIMIMRNAELL